MKVLVVRFSAIGDCVMTAWAVSALRNAVPDAQIFWAVQEKCSPVIDTGQLVNRVHMFPREYWKAHRWSPATWCDQIVRYTSLRKHGIDVGFDFQGHSKTALCLRLAGCKERFASRATDAFAARLNKPAELKPAGPHEVQLATALVESRFDAQLPDRPYMPELPGERELWRRHFGNEKSIVTIQTGAGEPDKTYPPGKWNHVADRLKSHGCFVIAIGGPADPCLTTPSAFSLVGTQTLEKSLALVANSDVHLSGDTGTAHAAAAYGVRTVTVFGRTDPDRFAPWGNNGTVLREGPETSNVEPERVVQATLGLLEGKTVANPH